MNWEVAGVTHPVEFFGTFLPEEVLYDFDGPRIFTVRSRDGDMLLVFQCDEDETISRFVVVPCNATLVDALKTGRRSVRDTLTQPWTWLVDQPHGQPIQRAWHADLSSIPMGLLPDDSVLLLRRLPTMEPYPSRTAAPAPRRRGAKRQFPAFMTVEARI